MKKSRAFGGVIGLEFTRQEKRNVKIWMIIHELRELWKKYPNLRFAQLLENFVFPHQSDPAKPQDHRCFFNDEDEDVLERIKKAMG